MQKKKRGKGEKTKIKRIFWIVLIILIIILIILLLVQFKETINPKKFFKKPELFVIKDDCSLIFNNIIHEIRSEEECHIFCNNECGVRMKEFSSVEFTENKSSCNTCNCYCK